MSKDIVPKKQSDLMLKGDIFTPFHPDSVNKIEYFKSEIKRLKREIEQKDKTIKNLKDIVNDVLNSKDELEKYRTLYKLYCIGLSKDINILQCADRIEKEECTFYNKCKPRKEIIEMLFTEKLRLI